MKRGFTLIELLVVIFIIAILIGLSVFGLQGARSSSRDAVRKADLEQIRSGIEIYKSDCGDYPDSLSFGGTLSGSCPTSNIYIQTIPNDPITPNQTYTYSKTGIGTYALCATLEQSTDPYCVANP